VLPTNEPAGSLVTSREAWAVVVPIGYRVGPWEVTAPIATGGWSSVYAGRRVMDGDTGVGSDGDDVALKFLPVGGLTPQQHAHLREVAEREVHWFDGASDARLITAFGSTAGAGVRRAALVAFALRFDLVRDDHLGLLPHRSGSKASN
jgi:hypothetical protein